MANPIIKIKRSNATTDALGTLKVPTLAAGEFGVDQINKNLYLGLESPVGTVTSVIVGGEGTFAKKTDLDSGLKYKGEMTITASHFSDADFGGAPGTTWEPPQTGFYYSVGAVTGGGVFKYGSGPTNITLVEGDALVKTTAGWQRLVGGTALSDAISDLGDVFHYEGTVSAADGTTPFDLNTLSNTDTGAYYKVGLTGIYTDSATTFNAKAGDAFVKTTADWQKIDNVDVVVNEVSGETAVTGDENAGYTVGLATAFKGRVSNLETKTQNIDLTGTVAATATTAATTKINGEILLKSGTAAGTKIKDIFGRGLVLGDDEVFLAASSTQVVLSAIGANAPDLSLNGAKVNIGGSFNPSVWPPVGVSTDDATEVTINSVTVKGNAAGTTTLENFVIDGGAY